MTEPEKDPASRSRSAETITFAVVSAIIAFYCLSILVLIITAVWIFDAPESKLTSLEGRSEIIRNGGLVVLGVIGLGFAIWRSYMAAEQTNAVIEQGKRTERQLEHTEKQLEHTARQVAGAEENNLAILLQKGAELLGDTTKRAHQAGGIAMLQAVITAENRKFVQEAMELIADFIDERFQNRNDRPLFRSAIKALELGHKRGFTAARTLDFVSEDKFNIVWTPFRGVTGISYTGGNVLGLTDEDFKGTHLRFNNVWLHNCYVPSVWDWSFEDCIFSHCRIGRVALSKNGRARFENCDFSGCLLGGSIVADVEFRGCHYRRSSPPDFPPEWLEKLVVREEAAISAELPAFSVAGSAVVMNAPANSQKPD